MENINVIEFNYSLPCPRVGSSFVLIKPWRDYLPGEKAKVYEVVRVGSNKIRMKWTMGRRDLGDRERISVISSKNFRKYFGT